MGKNMQQFEVPEELSKALARADELDRERERIRGAIAATESELEGLLVEHETALRDLADEEARAVLDGAQRSSFPALALGYEEVRQRAEARLVGLQHRLEEADAAYVAETDAAASLGGEFADACIEAHRKRWAAAVAAVEGLVIEGAAILSTFGRSLENLAMVDRLESDISRPPTRGMSWLRSISWRDDPKAAAIFEALGPVTRRVDGVVRQRASIAKRLEAEKPKPAPAPEPQSMVTVSATTGEEFQPQKPRKDLSGTLPEQGHMVRPVDPGPDPGAIIRPA
jgi:hypothetical protein